MLQPAVSFVAPLVPLGLKLAPTTPPRLFKTASSQHTTKIKAISQRSRCLLLPIFGTVGTNISAHQLHTATCISPQVAASLIGNIFQLTRFSMHSSFLYVSSRLSSTSHRDSDTLQSSILHLMVNCQPHHARDTPTSQDRDICLRTGPVAFYTAS